MTEDRAVQILKPFLCRNVGMDSLIAYGRKWYKEISLIQVRIRDVFACRFGKLEVLINYWDKTFGNLMTKAIELKDNEFIRHLK